jgi:ribosomal protein S27E
MVFSFSLFYKLRIAAAIIVLALALLYLNGLEKISLAGFAVLACITTYICNKLRLGTMDADCDLCGARGVMKAEYGAGFSNARLVINCQKCGRVINSSKSGIRLRKDR